MEAPDFLIYSSHKTGTQTLVATLRASSRTACHLHTLPALGLEAGGGQFAALLGEWRRSHGRKQRVISVFRLPLERHISSFFQWHGSGAIRTGLVPSTEATVIARLDLSEQMALFERELRQQTLVGYRDSLTEMAAELGLEWSTLHFSEREGCGRVETSDMEASLFRFDSLFADYPESMAQVVDLPLIPCSTNLSKHKWYSHKYADFKAALRLPANLIRNVYEDKRRLIDVFYPGRYDELLAVALGQHAA